MLHDLPQGMSAGMSSSLMSLFHSVDVSIMSLCMWVTSMSKDFRPSAVVVIAHSVKKVMLH